LSAKSEKLNGIATPKYLGKKTRHIQLSRKGLALVSTEQPSDIQKDDFSAFCFIPYSVLTSS